MTKRAKCSFLFSLMLLLVLAGLSGCNQIEMPDFLAKETPKQEGPAPAPTTIPTSIPDEPLPPPSRPALNEQERLITILHTNDMHGGLESQTNKDGARMGGLAILGGVVRSVREGLQEQLGERAGVLVLDGGDQFQGSLLSNFNEGELMFSAMNQVGYDAVVPGNHDYDFGPTGWLDDTVDSGAEGDNRAVIKKLARAANFPLLSANTFYRDSFRDITGKPIAIKHVGCEPADKTAVIDWSGVKQPEFLQSHVIKNIAGLRVALIGIDHFKTPESTAISNISDLCFGNEVESYLRVRERLEGKADVFVMLLHNGNINNEKDASNIVAKLTPDGAPPLVDAVVAGHTHSVHGDFVRGVPVVQAGANAKMFGRVDLVWDTVTRSVNRKKVRAYVGMELFYSACARNAQSFCGAKPELQYEGKKTTPDGGVENLIVEAKKPLGLIADRKVGIAARKLWTDRLRESPLANMATDAMRLLSGADIAIINTGGLRAPIAPGEFTYTDLFTVLPFNNRSVVIGPMGAATLEKILLRSAQSCGGYGVVLPSGIKVRFEKLCKKDDKVDPLARLLRVETVSGEVLMDAEKGIAFDPSRTFKVVTLDYLHGGGSGYADFTTVPLAQKFGIFREDLVDYLLAQQAQSGALVRFSGELDNRWVEVPRHNEEK